MSHFPSCDAFCLGIPWWDYWVPLIALQKQLNPKYLQNTVAYHIKHNINYSLKNWREVGIVFADFFIPDMAQKMRSILESGQLEELDEELGPNLTYEFIQMMYQNANLITYKSSFQRISKPIKSLSDFHLSDRMKFIHLHNQNLKIDRDRIDLELQYEYLIWLAWSSYCNNEWINMTRYLAESLRYNSDPKAKIIVNWIELFEEFSQDQKKPFDAYTLGQSLEWQKLIVSILL